MLGLVCLTLSGLTLAQSNANQPITLIIPYPPGGSSDMLARPMLPELQKKLGQTIVLDYKAGAGGTIGRDPIELASIINAVDHPRLGLCIDTCHAYVSGVDVTDSDQLDALVEELDTRIGIDRLRCLHVNDAAAACGSNRDRHANVGDGEMGAGLAVTLSHPRLMDLPMLLETPGHEGNGPDAQEISALRALHAQGIKRRQAA